MTTDSVARVHAAQAHAGLFFRHPLANPLQLGSIVPPGAVLCRRIAAAIRRNQDEAALVGNTRAA